MPGNEIGKNEVKGLKDTNIIHKRVRGTRSETDSQNLVNPKEIDTKVRRISSRLQAGKDELDCTRSQCKKIKANNLLIIDENAKLRQSVDKLRGQVLKAHEEYKSKNDNYTLELGEITETTREQKKIIDKLSKEISTEKKHNQALHKAVEDQKNLVEQWHTLAKERNKALEEVLLNLEDAETEVQLVCKVISEHKQEVEDLLIQTEGELKERNENNLDPTAPFPDEDEELISDIQESSKSTLDSSDQTNEEVFEEAAEETSSQTQTEQENHFSTNRVDGAAAKIPQASNEDDPQPESGQDNSDYDSDEDMANSRPLQGIPKFDGKSGTAQAHILSFEDWMTAKGKDLPGGVKEYIKNFSASLIGGARMWYEQWREEKGELSEVAGWTLIKNAFKNRYSGFGTTKYEREQLWKNLKWVPDGKVSLDDFVQSLTALGTDLGKNNEAKQLALKEAVPEYCQPFLIMDSKSTLDDMTEKLKQILPSLTKSPVGVGLAERSGLVPAFYQMTATTPQASAQASANPDRECPNCCTPKQDITPTMVQDIAEKAVQHYLQSLQVQSTKENKDSSGDIKTEISRAVQDTLKSEFNRLQEQSTARETLENTRRIMDSNNKASFHQYSAPPQTLVCPTGWTMQQYPSQDQSTSSEFQQYTQNSDKGNQALERQRRQGPPDVDALGLREIRNRMDKFPMESSCFLHGTDTHKLYDCVNFMKIMNKEVQDWDNYRRPNNRRQQWGKKRDEKKPEQQSSN